MAAAQGESFAYGQAAAGVTVQVKNDGVFNASVMAMPQRECGDWYMLAFAACSA
jgi:hypothetical protein